MFTTDKKTSAKKVFCEICDEKMQGHPRCKMCTRLFHEETHELSARYPHQFYIFSKCSCVEKPVVEPECFKETKKVIKKVVKKSKWWKLVGTDYMKNRNRPRPNVLKEHFKNRV